MKSNFFTAAVIALVAISNLAFAQTYYMQTTTSGSGSQYNLYHNSELKLGNSTSSTDRTRCVLKFGDGSNVQIGEWVEDNRLTFKASSFSFTGGSIYNAPMVDIYMGNIGSNYMRFQHNGTHGYFDFEDNLVFRIGAQPWLSPLTLFGNNTVGIGFPCTYNVGDYRNQGYKLAVNGNILCEEVKVIANVPDADFVFDAAYKLPSLEEVEKFVKTNKHLEGIPSAQEFKENGYKIGDMDTKLLQKVEELTLYLIELQKQNNLLKDEVEKLKSK